jgi:hypothetical protein
MCSAYNFYFVYRRSFSEIDDNATEDVIEEEYKQTQCTLETLRTLVLPPLKLPDDSIKPIGYGSLQYTQLDYKALIDIRRNHQTKQAATGVRTRKTDPNNTATI